MIHEREHNLSEIKLRDKTIGTDLVSGYQHVSSIDESYQYVDIMR